MRTRKGLRKTTRTKTWWRQTASEVARMQARPRAAAQRRMQPGNRANRHVCWDFCELQTGLPGRSHDTAYPGYRIIPH